MKYIFKSSQIGSLLVRSHRFENLSTSFESILQNQFSSIWKKLNIDSEQDRVEQWCQKNQDIQNKLQQIQSIPISNIKQLQSKKEKVEQLFQDHLKQEECSALTKAVKQKQHKMLNQNYGKQAETCQIKQDKIQQSNSCLYQKKVHDFPVPWGICGMVDGIEKDKIIEIKNRTKRIYKKVFDSERLQVFCYMFLLHMKRAEIQERHNESAHKHEILWDSEFFRKEIVEPLTIWVCLFETLNQDEMWQTAYRSLKTVEQKDELIETWLTELRDVYSHEHLYKYTE